jgi:secreted PhoX family phosphatase
MGGALWVMLAGCPRSGGPAEPVAPTPSAPADFRFLPVEPATDMASRTEPLVTSSATLGGSEVPVAFHVLRRSGEQGFGAVPALPGGPAPEGTCPDQDFNSLLDTPAGPVLVSHFECVPGAAYVSPLQVGEDGALTMTSTSPVSWDAWKGLWFPCSGQVSPWGTHLGSEEYEPNAALTGKMGPEEGRAWQNIVTYLGGDPAKVEPYRYGWATEIELPASGAPVPRKHFALGRFSHELSYVLPDQRTVVQSDDGTGVGLFLFVADTPGDLSAGALYAAKLGAGSAGETKVDWIPLGSADHETIAAAIDRGVRFTDLFARQEPGPDGACPAGSVYMDHHYGKECLALQPPSERAPDPALLASRLETRRYAAWKGATTELEKGEGVTFDPETGKVFLSLSSIAKRALREEGSPVDMLQLPENPCGAVMALQTRPGALDTDGAPIASEHVPVSMAPEVQGAPLAEPDAEGNRCAPGQIANPDNLTFLPGHGLLMIAEDTRRHSQPSLWAWSVRDQSLTRVVIAPRGGELTGIHWIPDLRGHAYLTLAIQHPWELPEGEALPPGVTAEDQRAFTGYLGPFPSLGR